ncbi:MAG: hypothetical protein JJ863_07390 [Deltaproteobacteria bacterium]|nr:hypothetical protein [Deltaproteobacteria bacterium]
MNERFLVGTTVKHTASASTLAEGFAGLRRRGQRAERIRRVGCLLLVPVAAVGLYFMVHGEVWWTGALGLCALVLARLATLGDPELADDPRVRLLEALFRDWKGPEPVTIDADLNAPDMTAPDETERVRGGVMKSRYVQRWLAIRFENGAELSLVHEREQIEDGVEVRDVTDAHRLIVAGDERPLDGLPTAADLSAALDELDHVGRQLGT